MPTPHLAAGSQQPPREDNKLRVYSMEFCPYAQRTRLVVNVKNVPHDIVNINLVRKPEWYFKIHPEGKVPSIDTGSQVIIESLVTADFLEEQFPDPPLYPKDPEAKKRDQELIKQIDSVTSTFYKVLFNKDKISKDDFLAQFAPHLQPFESELGKRGTFFGGNRPGMVDYMLWPWGERSDLFPLALGQQFDLFPSDKYPLLRKWREAMLQDPAAKKTYYGPEVHWKLMQSYIKKQEPDYDNLLKNL